MISTKRIWAAKPLLVAYVVAVGFTVGLLVNRAPEVDPAVPAMGGTQTRQQSHGHANREREAVEPPIWVQLFRPSQPTARLMLRMGLPILAVADGSALEQENSRILVYWTGRAEAQPQTFFQTMLPFLTSNQRLVAEDIEPPQPRVQSPAETTAPPVQGPPGPVEKPLVPPPATKNPPPAKPKPAAVHGGLPLVGIYHTHDWESYISEFPALAVRNADDLNKIQDHSHKKKTIMGIGQTLAVRLKELGVTTVFADATHQSLGYDYAYKASRETAKQILEKAPSVKILLDLHRDGAWGLDSTAEIKGKKVAQIRCIIGNNDQPRWEQNSGFCSQLVERLEKLYPGITLPTRVQEDRYNQDLAVGAVLLEIGSAMNSYDQAERSAVYLADALASLVRDGKYPR